MSTPAASRPRNQAASRPARGGAAGPSRSDSNGGNRSGSGGESSRSSGSTRADERTELLERLARELRAEGVETALVYGREDIPDQLLLALADDASPGSGERDGSGTAREAAPPGGEPATGGSSLQLAFYPGLDEPWLLQFYAPVPAELRNPEPAWLYRFLNLLNANLPLGSFGLLEGREVYYRYSVALEEGPVPAGLVLYLHSMVQFLFERFAGLIASVTAGLGYEESVASLGEVLGSLATGT